MASVRCASTPPLVFDTPRSHQSMAKRYDGAGNIISQLVLSQLVLKVDVCAIKPEQTGEKPSLLAKAKVSRSHR